MNAVDVLRKIAIEVEAAKRLISQLRDDGHGGDTELLADTLEGETSVQEAIAAGIDEIDNLEILIAGATAKEAAIAEFRKAKERRVEFIRAAIEQAMLATEQEKLALPTATVFVSKRKPGLIVENEADIPSEFFVAPETPAPRLDKKALAAALSEGRKVPGAGLDNGTVSLSIRRK
jgi:hypothetical protein